VWTRSHSNAVVARKRKGSVTRHRGGLAVAPKMDRKTLGRRKLGTLKIGLAVKERKN
jgi:hypothetical protein